MSKITRLMIGFFVAVSAAIVYFMMQPREAVRVPIGHSATESQFPSEVILNSSYDGSLNDQHIDTAHVIPLGGGRYSFEWTGYDGLAKAIIYHRPDSAVVEVRARLVKGEDQKFAYIYELRNSISSAGYLSGFVVQNFSALAAPILQANEYAGRMGSHIVEFSEGNWFRFGNNIFEERVQPGESAIVRIGADAPAAIVGARIHSGRQGMIGVGEDIPLELGNLLPRYEAWPSGYTIGPSDSPELRSFTGRAAYLLANLELVVSLGWLSDGLASRYSDMLAQGDEESTRATVVKDLQRHLVTTEIPAILGFLEIQPGK